MVLQIEIDRLNVYMLITSLEYAKAWYSRVVDFETGNWGDSVSVDIDQRMYWQRRINILNDVINQISVQDREDR